MTYAEMDEKLKEYSKILNYETELIPYLDEDEKLVLEGFKTNFSNMNKEQYRIKTKLDTDVGTIGMAIIRKIEKIIYIKQDISEFEDKYGGAVALDDFSLMLKTSQRILLKEYILNIDPRAWEKFVKNHEDITKHMLGKAKSYIFQDIDRFYKRKVECEKFVKKYGEDFLIHDFAPALERFFEDSEICEFVLYNVLMDYHYSFLQDIENELNRRVCSIKQKILSKLKAYLKRKQEVDYLLDKINIDEFNNYINSLNKIKNNILMDSVIAYAPLNNNQLMKKYGLSYKEVDSIKKEVRKDLSKLAYPYLYANANVETITFRAKAKKNKRA